MVKIAILNCYDKVRTLFNFQGENVGEEELLLKRIESFSKVKVESYDAWNDEFPKKDYDGYVISGSDFNPDRDSILKYEWMRNLLSFIRQTNNKKIPLLGICFGHQMVAVAFGAKVFELEELEVGFRKLELQPFGEKSKIYKSINKKFFGVFFHKWAVYKNSLPFGSKILALSPEIPEQATSFQFEETTFAVQFHPERVSKDVKVMFEQRKHMFSKDTRFNYTESSDANLKVLENFIKGISRKK